MHERDGGGSESQRWQLLFVRRSCDLCGWVFVALRSGGLQCG
jgi:hypothetical protein